MSILLKIQAKETSFTPVCKQDAEIPQDFREFSNIYIYRCVYTCIRTARQHNNYCVVSLLCVFIQ